MALKSKNEMLDLVKSLGIDENADSSIALVEAISDTYDYLSGKDDELRDFQKKYDDDINAWKKKYRDRFYSDPDKSSVNDDGFNDTSKPKKFEDLFKKGN